MYRRILSALRADIKFQVKQGFYAVYVFLTLVYMIILKQIPDKFQVLAVPMIVFSDPTIVGFFFIGGIIMLEKVQGVMQYMIVTPLRTMEYLVSKVMSLTILAIAAGGLITIMTYKGQVNWIYLFLGIALSSIFFTLYGFLAAAGCRTINKYFLKSVPYMLIIVFPCFSMVGFKYDWIFNLFPSVAGLKIVYGAFNGMGSLLAIILILYMAVFDLFMFWYVRGEFDRKIVYGGE